MILEATLLGLACALFWGFSDYFLSKGSKRTDLYISNILLKIPGLIILIPFIVLRGFDVAQDKNLYIMIAASSANTLAYFFFTKALSLGKASIIVPISAVYPVFTLLFGVVAAGVSISLATSAILVLIVAGVILISSNDATFSIKQFRAKPVMYTLLAAVMFGIAFGALQFVAGVYQWQELMLINGLSMLGYSLLMYGFLGNRSITAIKKELRHARATYIAGALLTIGSIFYNIGFEVTGSVAILTVLSSTGPLVVIALSRFIDNEQLRLYQYAGIILILLGIILLNN